jgi:hypothetical protein
MNRVFTDPRPQQFKADGSLNSNGKLYFYEPGATSTTKKAIYSDKGLASQLVNPVILDSAGRFPTIYLQESDYAVLHTNSDDVQIWRVNNYQPPSLDSQYNDWDASIEYGLNDFVRYTDGKYYISLQAANQGRTPAISSAYWSQGFFLTAYNSLKSYSTNDVVYYLGDIWTAYNGPHAGITPGTDDTRWRLPGFAPPKSGFIDASFTYLGGGAGATISYNVTANLAAATYESIGPTGSGADNIWASLPAIPSDAKALILTAAIVAQKTTGADERFSLSCQFRQTGGTRVFFGAQARGFGGTTHGQDDASSYNTFTVPLDSNLRFDGYWSTLGAPDSSTVTLYYVGYMR